ncbi:hypothetical protein BJ138DRAFT_1097808 [Hygrophoropsis aurantiaca]|uniref:Uncharacterized protein n=1 Tax=Hygrophoropsis aurantiaca TaxID=72124 RepID=A0ACB8AT48_9AGAM|nr:hypothetical protein BJ138DRAFT_1097808 [Hygrophoropsis aurantiaca]
MSPLADFDAPPSRGTVSSNASGTPLRSSSPEGILPASSSTSDDSSSTPEPTSRKNSKNTLLFEELEGIVTQPAIEEIQPGVPSEPHLDLEPEPTPEILPTSEPKAEIIPQQKSDTELMSEKPVEPALEPKNTPQPQPQPQPQSKGDLQSGSTKPRRGRFTRMWARIRSRRQGSEAVNEKKPTQATEAKSHISSTSVVDSKERDMSSANDANDLMDEIDDGFRTVGKAPWGNGLDYRSLNICIGGEITAVSVILQ